MLTIEIIKYASVFILALTLLLGVVVLANGPRNRINQTFALLSIAFASWIFTNLMVDLSTNINELFFWSQLSALGPILAPILLAYFASIFPMPSSSIDIGVKKWQRIIIIFLSIGTIIELILMPTAFNMQKVIFHPPFHEFEAGLLYPMIFISLTISIIFSVCSTLRKIPLLDKKGKYQVLLVLIGIITACIIGVIAGITLYLNNYILTIVSPLFSIFVVILTAYAIIRYSTFNINMAVTNFFILVLFLLVSFEITLSKSLNELIIKTIIFLSVLIAGYFLIRNIIMEVERKKEIQELANKLEKSNEELQKLSCLKDDFIHLTVHEINTPMASILGYLSLILDEKIAKIDKKAEGYLQIIYASSRRLAGIVDNFLNIVKIEGGKLKMEFTKISMEKFLEEIILEYEQKAREKNNKITIQSLNLDEIEINIDTDKLKEALINLVDNAIKFTRDGEIELIMGKYENRAVIIIKDNGEGMPKEALEQVFNKFYQALPSSPNINPQGTGLGLYITKTIIEMHGGKIIVESLIGKGTKFTIFLPL